MQLSDVLQDSCIETSSYSFPHLKSCSHLILAFVRSGLGEVLHAAFHAVQVQMNQGHAAAGISHLIEDILLLCNFWDATFF